MLNPFFLGALLTLTLYLSLPPFFEKYRIELLKNRYDESVRYLLHDMDRDGRAEQVVLYFTFHDRQLQTETNKKNSSLNIHRYSDITQIVEGNDQLNWHKEFIEGIRPVLGDYNADGKDEVYVFCRAEDSVFVVGLDPLGGKGVFLERFLHRMSYREGARDFTINPCGIFDLNKDGYGEVVFSLISGFGKSPRALCALDIRNDSLWMHERKYHQYQGNPFVIFQAGEPYLFSSSYAPGNHPDTASGVVPDTAHDFTIYGRDLQPQFPHLRFTGYTSGLTALPIKVDGKWHAYVHHNRPSNHSTKAMVLDLEGREVARWEPEIPMDASVHPYGGPEREQVLAYEYFNGIGHILDSRLRVLREVKGLPRQPDHFECYDLNGDSLLEHIFLDLAKAQLIIYDHNLENPLRVDYPRDARNLWFSSGYIPANGQVFQVSSQNTVHTWRYERNPLSYWEIPIFLSFFFLFSGILGLIFHYRDLSIRRQFEQKQRILELELLTLRNLIEPHFTFNVLNMIGSQVIQGKNDEALGQIYSFSSLLRIALQNGNKIAIPLSDELAFTREYLEVQRMRFNASFIYAIELNDSVSPNTLVPRLCIHTFVENALKHGLTSKSGDGLLNIKVIQEEAEILISIEDNGPGREATRGNGSTGRGLEIMNEMFGLYRRFTGTKASYTVKDLYTEDGRPAGTRVVVMVDG